MNKNRIKPSLKIIKPIRKMTRRLAIQKKKAELKKQVFFDPTYDPTFKKIFKKGMNLIHFLNAMLHLEGEQRIVHITPLKPKICLETKLRKTETVCKKPKIVCFDIHASTANGEYFDVEMQRAIQEDFLDRIEYYSSMLSVNAKITMVRETSQKRSMDHPYLMPKVYSIWICNFNVDFCENYREEISLYRASDVGKPGALPIYPKKRYIIVDLTKYVPNNDDSAESRWLNLFKTMPYAKRTPKCKDEIFAEIYECMRIDKSTDEFITEVAANMIDRDEYNAGMSYARRTGFEEGEARGVAKTTKKFAARDKKIAKYLRSKGVSPEILATALAIK